MAKKRLKFSNVSVIQVSIDVMHVFDVIIVGFI